jgi:tetratricopeptide (TPR) repeat protein
VARERIARAGSLATLGEGIASLLTVVTQSLTEPWQSRPASRDTVQQIMALHVYLTPYLSDDDIAVTKDLLRLRGWAVWCLNELGDSFAQAMEYGRRQISEAEQVLGTTHPDTLTDRNNLAAAYRDARRLAEAIALLKRTLTDCEQALGAAHPDTLASCKNLVLSYQAAGRLKEAEELRSRQADEAGGAEPNHG